MTLNVNVATGNTVIPEIRTVNLVTTDGRLCQGRARGDWRRRLRSGGAYGAHELSQDNAGPLARIQERAGHQESGDVGEAGARIEKRSMNPG